MPQSAVGRIVEVRQRDDTNEWHLAQECLEQPCLDKGLTKIQWVFNKKKEFVASHNIRPVGVVRQRNATDRFSPETSSRSNTPQKKKEHNKESSSRPFWKPNTPQKRQFSDTKDKSNTKKSSTAVEGSSKNESSSTTACKMDISRLPFPGDEVLARQKEEGKEHNATFLGITDDDQYRIQWLNGQQETLPKNLVSLLPNKRSRGQTQMFINEKPQEPSRKRPKKRFKKTTVPPQTFFRHSLSSDVTRKKPSRNDINTEQRFTAKDASRPNAKAFQKGVAHCAVLANGQPTLVPPIDSWETRQDSHNLPQSSSASSLTTDSGLSEGSSTPLPKTYSGIDVIGPSVQRVRNGVAHYPVMENGTTVLVPESQIRWDIWSKEDVELLYSPHVQMQSLRDLVLVPDILYRPPESGTDNDATNHKRG